VAIICYLLAVADSASVRQTKRRVLLVEDERIVALSEQRTLERYGYVVTTVHSGEDAVAAVRDDGAFDLVLMDIDLGPGIDGTEAATLMLEIRELPVVFLTGHAEREIVDRVKGITCYGYVLKASGEFVLIQAIEMASELFASRREAIVGYQATGRDVTDRVNLERSLTYHRDLLQKIMYTTPTSILVLDAGGTITHINRYAGEVLGVDPAEVEGLRRDELPWRLESGEGVQMPMDEGPFATVRRTGRPVLNGEYTLRRPDGGRRLLEISSAPLLTPDGGFYGTVAVLEDVTERVRAERQIARREARFRELFEQSPSGIMLADAQSRIVDVNPRAVEMLGYSREELLSMGATDLIPAESLAGRPLARTLAEAAESEGFVEIDSVYRCKDGSLINVVVRVRRLGDLDDRVDHMITFNDTTARREADERIRSLLEEKDLLIREIHHRVKNDLNLVRSLASLQRGHSSHKETKDALQEMINRLAVMSRVYDGLRSGDDLRRVALDELLDTLVEGLRQTTLPAGVTLGLDAPHLMVRQPLAVAIGIMVNELVTNSLRHGLADAAQGSVLVRATPRDGTLDVVVADSGPGFPAVFLREQTYGYGLTIVDALARQHGGSLDLDNADGARARIVVPLER
jgi:two-component system, sensor histidine kinase PdtaS